MKITQIYLGGEKVSDLLSKRLQLDDDVIHHLLNSDDWEMMIFAWALVEACLNQAIIKCIGKDSLSSFVEKLSIGGKTGKTELAFGLGLLSQEERIFLNTFSEVRNRFAHGVRRFKTTFDEYFESVDNLSKYENSIPIRENVNEDGTVSTTFSGDKRTAILMNTVALCLNLTKS